MRYITIVLFAFLLVFNCTANGTSHAPATSVSEQDDPPSRWQLRRSFYDKGEILVVYNAQNEESLAAYELFFSKIEKEALDRRGKNIQIKYKVSSKVSKEEIKNSVLLVVGTAESNPLVSKLTAKLPLRFSEAGFRFNEKDFHEQHDILSCSYFPNWQREGYLYWAARLKESSNVLSMAQLLNNIPRKYANQNQINM